MYFVDVGVKMCLLLTSSWQPSIVRFRHAAATLFVLGFVLPASALTIGRPQGAAWIGKPLNIVIPLTLDGSEVGGSLCPQVEVVQGDAAMDERRVSVSLEPGAAPDAPRLRVRTSRAVEEPIVTVTVKAGCAATSTRQVVLLADPPPVDAALPSLEAPGEAARTASGTAPQRSPARVARAARAEGGSEVGAERRRASAPAVAARSARNVAPERQNAEAAARRRAAAPARANAPAGASSGGRLQIDALAPLAPREAAAPAPAAVTGQASPSGQTPATATALPPTSAASGPARNEATAAVAPQPAASAPSVVAPTPEAVRDAQRTVALEQALASLREQTARNEQTLLEMRRELAAARESRYSNPLVYALVLLLLLALAALVWMWLASRRAAQSVWWPEGGGAALARSSQVGGLDDAADTYPGENNAGAERALAAAAATSAVASGAASHGVPSGFIDPDAPRSEDHPGSDLRHADFDAPALPGQSPPSSRSVNTEELFDVQQQAEFFLSLGQHEQAIAVLSEYVADHPDTSALAYLELLRIFHSLGRMLDYERVRRQCQQALNVRVPSFDDFHQDAGRPLDHHNEVLQRIEEHWPGPESLPVIEELLFRRPGEDGQPTFDLAAYRELLMLYAMAQEQPVGGDSQRPSLAEVLMRHQQHETLPMALSTSAVELPTAPQSLARDTSLVEPRHADFQPTRPPHPLTASLDFDLDDLDMAGVDTIPAALRRAEAEKPKAAPVIEPAALDQPSTQLASASSDTPSAQLPELELFDPEIEESIKPGALKR